jgi:hypothetical protein
MKMKKLYIFATSLLLVTAGNIKAQPVILNGSNLPAAGFSATIVWANTALITSLGFAAGPNMVWDYSSIPMDSFTIKGPYNTVSLASAPDAATFPTSNYVFNTTIQGALTYNYMISQSNKLAFLGAQIGTVPGSGAYYTTAYPGPFLEFPFNYGDIVKDSFQRVGQPIDTITLSYDAYGTLKFFNGTYTNVFRVKYVSPGKLDYIWWATNPLMPILDYEPTNGTFTVYDFTPIPSGINSQKIEAPVVSIAPNPCGTTAVLRVHFSAGNTAAVCLLQNSLGQKVKEIPLSGEETTISRNDLPEGLYFYEVRSNNTVLGGGKLVFE